MHNLATFILQIKWCMCDSLEFATSKVVPLTAAERKQLNFKLSQNDVVFFYQCFFIN